MRDSCVPVWQAGVTGKWLKMMFTYGWGAPYQSGSRRVYARVLPCGLLQEVEEQDVTSHIVKHGAATNVGSASVPASIIQQVRSCT